MTTNPLDRALDLLDERDSHDPSSEEHTKLDAQAFDLIWPVAVGRDLRGFELWYGNGPDRQGIVTGTYVADDTLRLIVDGKDDYQEGIVYDLACGWLQHPGLPVDGDFSGLRRTIDVLRSAPPLSAGAEAP